MRKINNLGLAVATAMGLALTGNVFADGAGDSAINFPKDDSTISDAGGVNVNSSDVWFVKDDNAIGYSLSLIMLSSTLADATATNAALCAAALGTASTAPTDTNKAISSLFLPADSLSCDEDSIATLTTITGDVSPAAGAGIKVCNWSTPILADGAYAIAINPIHIGSSIISQPELITAIGGGGRCSDDTGGHTDNNSSDYSQPTDGHWQTFAVNATAVVTAGVTEAPLTPVPTLPAAGGEYLQGTGLTFVDNSLANGLATWYELWVYDINGSRVQVTAPDAHVGSNNWFKVGVDSALACTTPGTLATATMPANPDARQCVITLADHIITGLADTLTDDVGTYTWYVLGYNGFGKSAWSAPATFINGVDNN